MNGKNAVGIKELFPQLFSFIVFNIGIHTYKHTNFISSFYEVLINEKVCKCFLIYFQRDIFPLNRIFVLCCPTVNIGNWIPQILLHFRDCLFHLKIAPMNLFKAFTSFSTQRCVYHNLVDSYATHRLSRNIS